MLWFNKITDILCNLINVSNIFLKKYIWKKIDKYIDKYIDKNIDKIIDKNIDKTIDKNIDKNIDNYIDKNIDKTENIQNNESIKKVSNSIEDMLFFYDDEPITF